NSGVSYKLVTPKEDPSLAYEEIKRPAPKPEAAVSNVLPLTPAPVPADAVEAPAARAAARDERAAEPRPGMFARLFGWLKPPAAPTAAPPAAERARGDGRAAQSARGQRNRDRGERDRDHERRRDRGREQQQQRRRQRAEG